MRRPADIFIIGAGPAGVCAALRLQQLGYNIVLIERSATWPRPQIGESLTPGIRNIIDLLDANDVLLGIPHLTQLPTRLCWRHRIAETVSHADAAIVDRAAFDDALLQLARRRGIEVHQPAVLDELSGSPGAWRLSFSTPDAKHELTARMILDASGRRSTPSQHWSQAPRLSALWVEIRQDLLPADLMQHTQVEALPDGWLWSSPLPGARYRVMLLADPTHLRQRSSPLAVLQADCATSTLFKRLAHQPFGETLRICSARPYVALDSWQEGRIQLGDAAFALDPVSSSGVEKAMRFSLQAALAAHSWLQSGTSQQRSLARSFYQERLIETYARHHFWTNAYYRQAWCSEHPFWQNRSDALLGLMPQHPDAQALGEALQQKIRHLACYRSPVPHAGGSLQMHQHLRFAAQTRVVMQPCATHDAIEIRPALTHPHLERPLAFWENEAILPRLDILLHATPLVLLLASLSPSMGREKAFRLLLWLWQRGVVDASTV